MSPEPKHSVFSVLAHRDFRRLWLADVVSDAGSFITFIALAVYVHDLTGEAVAVGFALALRAIPWFTIGPIAGVIADRVDRRLMMVVCDLARAGLVVLLPFTDTAGQAYAISFASGIFGPIFRPARQALIPLVVPGDQYVRALAVGEVSHQVLHTIGPALGGAAVLAVGARNAFFLDAGTFLLSAVLVVGVGVRGSVRGRPTGFGDVGRDLAEGARVLLGQALLRRLLLARAALVLGEAGIIALLVSYIREDLGRSGGAYGLALAVGGVGTAGLSWILAQRGARVRRTPWLLVSAASPLLFVPVLARPGFAGLLVVMFLEGLAITGFALYREVIVVERTADAVRGRVFGLSGAIVELADFAGSLGLAAVGDALGVSRGIALAGALAATLTLLALAPALRELRAEDAERTSASDEKI